MHSVAFVNRLVSARVLRQLVVFVSVAITALVNNAHCLFSERFAASKANEEAGDVMNVGKHVGVNV